MADGSAKRLTIDRSDPQKLGANLARRTSGHGQATDDLKIINHLLISCPESKGTDEADFQWRLRFEQASVRTAVENPDRHVVREHGQHWARLSGEAVSSLYVVHVNELKIQPVTDRAVYDAWPALGNTDFEWSRWRVYQLYREHLADDAGVSCDRDQSIAVQSLDFNVPKNAQGSFAGPGHRKSLMASSTEHHTSGLPLANTVPIDTRVSYCLI